MGIVWASTELEINAASKKVVVPHTLGRKPALVFAIRTGGTDTESVSLLTPSSGITDSSIEVTGERSGNPAAGTKFRVVAIA